MSEKINFVVTEKAGPWVAGFRSPGVGKPLPLTEEQAKYALITGEIERPADKPAKKAKTESKAEAKSEVATDAEPAKG